MKASQLTDERIEEIVTSHVNLLETGKYMSLNLNNEGPDWSDEAFLKARAENLKWWAKNGPSLTAE